MMAKAGPFADFSVQAVEPVLPKQESQVAMALDPVTMAWQPAPEEILKAPVGPFAAPAMVAPSGMTALGPQFMANRGIQKSVLDTIKNFAARTSR